MENKTPILIKVKVDLEKNYTWTKDESSSAMNDKLFNRKNGHEVSEMIQWISDELHFTEKEQVSRVEHLIDNFLPGNIRSIENVKEWLRERLDQESGVLQEISHRLSYVGSETLKKWDVFSKKMQKGAELSKALLDLAKDSDFVREYGTFAGNFDSNEDYSDVSPLYSDTSKTDGHQAWYQDMSDDPGLCAEALNYNFEGDDFDGMEIFEEFQNIFEDDLQALVIYNNPSGELASTFERKSHGEFNASGVYVVGGIDPNSGRLIGFMVECIYTNR
jgi:hypothetical protein